jgi:hypothetical protein
MQSGIRLAFFGGPPYLFLYLFSHLADLMHALSLPISSLVPKSDILPDFFMYWPYLARGLEGSGLKKQPQDMAPPFHLMEGEKEERRRYECSRLLDFGV